MRSWLRTLHTSWLLTLLPRICQCARTNQNLDTQHQAAASLSDSLLASTGGFAAAVPVGPPVRDDATVSEPSDL
jgi:hypothetical protein